MRLLKFLVSCLLICGPLAASDKPSVFWYNEHYPPTFISKGDDINQGFGDKTLAFFLKQLPQFNHEMLYANVNRTLAEIRENDGVCVLGLIRTTAREQFMSFSKPVFHTLPNRLIVLKDKMHLIAPYVGASGTVDLPLLMTDSGLVAGIIVDRVYSSHINKIIDDNKERTPRIDMPHPRYVPLLLRGRIDYTLGFSYEAAYQFKKQGKENAFISLPVAGEAETVSSGVACSIGPIGRQVITAVDHIIDAQGAIPSYHAFYEEWLDPAALEDSRRAVVLSAN